MLETVLLCMIVFSWAYWITALWMVRAFFHSQDEPDLAFRPPVSILKPVRGLDAQAFESFASFCRQDYPAYELLFGVSEPADPSVPVIRSLMAAYPELEIRLVVAEDIGANLKTSILTRLAAEAQHELLVISDSDMLVAPDYLQHVVAPLADGQVGLVTCPYRGASALTFTARLEALHMGVTFLPSVVVARSLLSMRFAMGATIALRRGDLARVGGFAAFADYLADDFQVAVRIADLGLQVRLSRYIVTSVLGATTWLDQWQREVRWARCNRVSRPREYPGLLLTFSTPLAASLVLVSWFEPMAWRMLLVSVLLRWAVAWLITYDTDDEESRRWMVWLPVRDMLSAAVWCAGAVGRSIVWRGRRFILRPGGRMEAVPELPATAARVRHSS